MRYKVIQSKILIQGGQLVTAVSTEGDRVEGLVYDYPTIREGHEFDAALTYKDNKLHIVPNQAGLALATNKSLTYFVTYCFVRASLGTLSFLGIKQPYNRSHWGALASAICCLLACYISIIEPEVSLEAFFLALVYGAFTFAFVRQAKRKQNNEEAV